MQSHAHIFVPIMPRVLTNMIIPSNPFGMMIEYNECIELHHFGNMKQFNHFIREAEGSQYFVRGSVLCPLPRGSSEIIRFLGGRTATEGLSCNYIMKNSICFI